MTYEAFQIKYELTAPRAAYLVSRFLRQLLNDSEWQELDDWITANNDNQVLFEKMIQPERFEKESLTWYPNGVGVLEQKVLRALLKEGTRTQPVYRLTWFRVAAAVVVIAGLIIGAWQILGQRKSWTDITASVTTITTPDGKEIESTQIGDLPRTLAGGGVISESNDVMNYSFSGRTAGANRYYVVQVPGTFMYRIRLQDGSKLYCAANTVVRFPESFSASERVIEIRGHVYVEIARDKRPFKVKFSNGYITSSNGHFDIQDTRGEYTAIVTAKGEGLVYRSLVAERQLEDGFRTTLEENRHTRHERVDVELFTAWRLGFGGGMKHIFMRGLRGDYPRLFDSLYTNDSIK